MVFPENEFQAKQSERAEKATFLAKAVGYLLYAITALGIIALTVTILFSNKTDTSLKILPAIFATCLLFFLFRTFFKQLAQAKENKITAVLVDQQGFHHVEDFKTVKSITFDALRPNPGKKYDIDLSDGDDVSIELLVYHRDDVANEIVCKAITFETSFSIKNGEELKKHFISGIMLFRPDLKIAPRVLDFFDMKDQ
ncbi:hypothetical protein ACTJKC_04805 [Pedobacter sp. 22226]|uniref:hypothetical protein n=1 Tax=Pedobacter sp. 22226 TaxID=3453894 RepID=UPI003F83B70D